LPLCSPMAVSFLLSMGSMVAAPLLLGRPFHRLSWALHQKKPAVPHEASRAWWGVWSLFYRVLTITSTHCLYPLLTQRWTKVLRGLWESP
jgi:hypothetical protein